MLLRTEAQLAGDPFAITEVTAIAFDNDLPDELFELLPEDEEPPRPEVVSIEDAARRAPFTVLMPTHVLRESRLAVRLMRAVGSRPFTVTLSYHLPASLHHLQITEYSEASGLGDPLPWTAEEHDGQRFWVWAPSPGSGRADALAKVVRDGTEVRIMSDLGIDLVRAVALSLVPAPTEPPGLS